MTELAISNGHSTAEMGVRLHELKKQVGLVQQFFSEVMVEGQDYGKIPGTEKPTLLKPGAEKLCEFYGYSIGEPKIDEIVDQETGFYRARCTINLLRRDGSLVASGVGEANTKEGRYRWRHAERTCPQCGTAAIIKGKEEFGGGWLCFAKKGGCGAKYSDQTEAITQQPTGKVENDDPWMLWNTILKMAKKRALVDVTLSATRSSGLFTQDAEDLQHWIEGEVVTRQSEPARQPSRQPRGQRQGPPASALPSGEPLPPVESSPPPWMPNLRQRLQEAGLEPDALQYVIHEPTPANIEAWWRKTKPKTDRIDALVMAVLEAKASREEEAKQPAVAGIHPNFR